jgi:hypothetical protein
MCCSVFNLQKLPLGSANTVAKKRRNKQTKKRKGKDDRMLIRSNLTIFNLIFCGPEWTEEIWQSQGFCGYIHPPLSLQSLRVTMDQRQQVVVVHGSGQILNRLCEDIMQSSQWLLDALSSQGWNMAAIKGQLKLMSSMIEERHERYKGVWFSGFVGMGRGGLLEMITTCEVHAVSDGGGLIQSV